MRRNRLYLSTDLETLADKLQQELAAEERAAKDFFLPANLVVPSAQIKSWLRQTLARRQGIAINLRVRYLETALWEILSALCATPNAETLPPVCLEHDRYRLLVLSILLDEKAGGAALQPLRQYLGAPELRRREFCRRVWEISDTLARLIREYEYHRQDEFIQFWLRDEAALADSDADTRALEQCQRALFRLIVDEPDGLRALLSRQQQQNLKTLPQFANEVMERAPRTEKEWPAWLHRPVHLFGIGQISTYHVRVLRWLGKFVDLRMYHANPLVAQLPRGSTVKAGALQMIARQFDSNEVRSAAESAQPLLQLCGQAGAASFHCLAGLLESGASAFQAELAPPPDAPATDTVLHRVQSAVVNTATGAEKLPQDKSLQIVACPGAMREVETVYQSILQHLLHDSALRLSDFTIAVSDMAQYRPVIQTVFDRHLLDVRSGQRNPTPLLYQFADYSAGCSVFGQALLGMADAALEGFSRRSVMAVLLNPCFLARFNVEREQACVWLDWTERLGVYHGWDRADKKQAGFSDSRLFSWKLALQRLRLGLIMDAPQKHAAAYRDVVPYADLHSSDSAQLDVFCRAVEELLPRLLQFLNAPASAGEWARRLAALVNDFLEVPENYPDEEQVRGALLAAFPSLRAIGVGADEKKVAAQLSLPLVREFVQATLEELTAGGAHASGAIGVVALQQTRLLPHRFVYVLGLGEGIFPSGEIVSPFDLREKHRARGDLKPQDTQRAQFLEALLAAREKLYLCYNCRDLQKDQTLHPSPLLNKLRQYLNEQVLSAPHEIIHTPLNAHDPQLLLADERGGKTDVLRTNASPERLLALQEALNTGRLAAADIARAKNEIQQALARMNAAKQAPVSNDANKTGALRVSVRDLAAFLRDPADAALKRHLRLRDEWNDEPRDDEPFYTEDHHTRALVQETLTGFAAGSAHTAGAQPQTWQEEFTREYDVRAKQGLAPDGAFRDVDLRRFKRLLDERINGEDGLAAWLEQRQQTLCCGPLQLGESLTPSGATLRFPAARFQLDVAGEQREVLLSGVRELVWSRADCVEVLTIFNGRSSRHVPEERLTHFLFEPVLFYLALLCGEDSGNPGASARAWINERPLKAIFALDDGFSVFNYPGITPEQARAYLAVLLGAYLDPRSFEHLPFHIISEAKDLRAAYETAAAASLESLRDDFRARLQTLIDEQSDNDFGRDDRLRVLDLLAPCVPAYACEKVRARFQLLDLGPRLNRDAAATAAAPQTKSTRGGSA